ncbi:MAG: hypothetical protein Q4E05_05540, partial [Pseudoclavibacter sp.]|nr:hypothetical protein [Pseudoclavibacter sp.]
IEMPSYAVLVSYEVVSALVVEADSADEAAKIASDFESDAQEAVDDAAGVRVWSRELHDGEIDVEQARDEEAAEELLDEWLDELEDDDEDDEA